MIWKIVILLLALVCAQTTAAQCETMGDWSTWVNCKIKDRMVARAARDATIRNPSKDAASPSIDANSTSLVDQTSAPDLLGLASNLAALNSKKAGERTNAFTVSTSAYALYAAANREDPLNPSFYMKGRNWRRLSFTLGREIPEGSDAVHPEAATVIGTKLLILAGRDLATLKNAEAIEKAIQPITAAAIASLAIAESLEHLLGITDDQMNKRDAEFQNVIRTLTTDKNAAINELVDTQLAPLALEREALEALVKETRGRPQWSINFQSKNRDKDGVDEYRLETAFDFGLRPRVNFTIDAGFLFKNSKILGLDERGARVAGQFSFRITDDPVSPKPIIINLAFEGKGETSTAPTYRVQCGSSFPLFDGVNVPLSITWANRADLIKEEHVRARFGLTFDFSRLATKLR
jgi:hypothetical protein